MSIFDQPTDKDFLACHVECLQAEVERLNQRLAVRCEHPYLAQCARLWQADNEHRQLMAISPALAEEFPWGCDTVEHLAAALVASRAEVERLTAQNAKLLAIEDAD